MFQRSLTRCAGVLAVALVLAACSGTATSAPPSSARQVASPGSSVPGSGASAVPAASPAAAAPPASDGYQGTLTSSGVYAAKWTVAPDSEANPFNAASNPSLTSDKNTFGNIKVETDGSVNFGSATPELTDLSFVGTGAKVTLDKTSQFVCAFTLDSDLKGTRDNAVLHMSGSMTVHWHPLGSGDLSCP